MRRLALALGLIGFAGGAFAADLPFPTHEPIAYVPAFPSYFPWQGFYVGGQLTGADANADFKNTTQPLLALAFRNLTLESEIHPSDTVLLGASESRAAGLGAFAGYNWQFENAIVGVEFSYTHTDLTVTAPDFPIGRLTPTLSNGFAYTVDLSANGTLEFHDVGTFRGRFGWVVDNFVPYATFGLAVARADWAVSATCLCQQGKNNPAPGPQLINVIDFSFTQSISKSGAFLFGYSGGFGVDVALTRNLFGRAEYEFIQFTPVSNITSHIQAGHVGLGLKF